MATPNYMRVLNWEKYQARTDKDLPWCKLWGTFFDKFWWMDLKDKHKIFPIILLDLARRYGNKIPHEALICKNLYRTYAVRFSKKEIENILNLLCDKEFLSDDCRTIVGLDKIRIDKIREDKESASPPLILQTPNLKALVKTTAAAMSPRKVSLVAIQVKNGDEFLSEGAKHKIYNKIVELFDRRGWAPELLLKVFETCAGQVGENGYQPKSGLYPYFEKVVANYINQNAESLSIESKKIFERTEGALT